MVGTHPLSHCCTSAYQAAHSFGYFVLCKYFFNYFLTCNSTNRCFFAWLPNNYITANQCQHGIPAPHSHRKIKCRNNSYNAKRMVLLIHPVLRALAMHGKSVQLSAQAHRKITDIYHFLHFAQTFLQTFPHFKAYQTAKVIFIVAKFIANLPYNFASFWSRVGTPFCKSLFCNFHRSIINRPIGLLHTCNGSTIYRRIRDYWGTPCFYPRSASAHPVINSVYL